MHSGSVVAVFSGIRNLCRSNTLMNFDLTAFAKECGVAEPEKFAQKAELLRDIVLEANNSFNLTRITDPVEFMVKHVADSLAIGRYFPEEIAAAKRVADLGCGGGFPTLVLALAYPHLQVTGIDSTGKKVRFVQETADKLGLGNVNTVHARVEELNRKKEFIRQFDIVTARAVAQGKILAKYASNFPVSGGAFIFYKTPNQAAEDLQTLNWQCSEEYDLPLDMGTRVFLYHKI